jgi:hypothetical protein
VRNSGSKDERLASNAGNGFEKGGTGPSVAALYEEYGEIAGKPPDPPEIGPPMIGKDAISNGTTEVPASRWASASLGNLPIEGTAGIAGNAAPN